MPEEQRARLDAAWGLWLGLVGGFMGAALDVFLVSRQKSSTAAILYLDVPFAFLGAALFVALFVWSLQWVVLDWRTRMGLRRRLGWLLAAAFVVASTWAVSLTVRRVAAFYRLQSTEDAGVLAETYPRAMRRHDYLLLSAIGANPETPPDVLMQIVRNDDPLLHEKRRGIINLFDRDTLAVVRKVLRNPATPEEAIPLLATSTNAYVLGDVAEHRGTPPAILRDLDRRSDSYLVRWGLARNPGTPTEILARLASESDPESRDPVMSGLASNPGTPPPVLASLARHPDANVRGAVAQNPGIGEAIASILIVDEDRFVRLGLTSNEAVGIERLLTLSDDPDEAVRRYAGFAISRVARDPATSRPVLRELAALDDPLVRRDVAGNWSIDLALMAELLEDPEPRVRAALAGNRSLPPDVLFQLARDPDGTVAGAARAEIELRRRLAPADGRETELAGAEAALKAPREPAGNPVARLVVRFGGEPLTNVTSTEPEFWFSVQPGGGKVHPTTHWRGSEASVFDLEEGRYRVTAAIDEEGNDWAYPGDFEGTSSFEITPDTVEEVAVDVERILHLLAPVDNRRAVAEEGCRGILVEAPTVFAWEPMDRDAEYRYRVERIRCNPYRVLGVVTEGATTDSRVTLTLPPSTSGEVYGFVLEARRGPHGVGHLVVHYARASYGWSLRFRVED